MFKLRKGTLIPLLASTFFFVSDVRAEDPLVVAVSRTPLSLPFFIVEQEGLAAKHGATVRFDECLGGHRCMQMTLAGDSDAGTASDLVISKEAIKHSRFFVLATFVSSDQDVTMIVNRQAGITTPDDLRGKRVAYTPGTSSHYFLDTFLLLRGIAPDQVQSVEVQPEDMSTALEDGEVDAVATWEPWSRNTMDSVTEASAIDSRGVYTLTFNLVARSDSVADKQGEFRGLIRALKEAVTLISTNPDLARMLLMKRLAMNEQAADRVLPTLEFRLALAQSLIVTLESEAQWARRTGLAESDNVPNFLDYIKPEILKELSPDAVTLVK